METEVQPQKYNYPELQPELEPEPELEPGSASAATTGVLAQPAPAVAHFLEHIDAATGRKYYSNEATQAVSWELPAGAVVRPPGHAVCHDELTTEQREVQAQREATERKARQLLETIAATRLSNEEAVAARRAAEAAASSQAGPSGSPSLPLTGSDENHQMQCEVDDDTGGATPRTLHSEEQQQRIKQLETKVRRLQVALGKASRTEDNTRSTLAGELDEEREKLLTEVETEKQEAAGKVRAIEYKLTKVEAALATAEARVQELESSFDARVAAAVRSQLDAQGHGTTAGSSLQHEMEQLKVALETALKEKEAARVAAEVKACERVAAVLEQTNFEREQNDEVLGGRLAELEAENRELRKHYTLRGGAKEDGELLVDKRLLASLWLSYFESRGRRKTEVLNVIANVLSLTEQERVSLGLLSAWEVQLKHMMGNRAANSVGGSRQAEAAGGQAFVANGQVGSPSEGISPRKLEHGSTLSAAAGKTEARPEQAGGGFGDLWATFLRTDV